VSGIGLSAGVRRVGALDFVPANSGGDTLTFSPLGDGTADTGDTVSEGTALNVAAFWRGMTLISTAQAMLPLIVYQRTARGGKERATDHWLYPVLHQQPNQEMTSFTFRQTLASHVVTWGNGYAEKVTDGRGRVLELWPLRPDRMEVQRERLTVDQLRAGQRPRRRYKYSLATGEVRYIDADRIHHVRGLGYDGLVGYPVLTLMRNALAMTRAFERYGAATFKNGARPAVVLTHPSTLSETARDNLAEDWRDKYGGLDNAHRVAVLEEGIQIKEIGFPPQDAQFLQSRQFQVLEFARWLGVPPHKLYELSRATYSNIEQQSLEYLADSLNGWLVNWEQQFQLDLFPPDPNETFFPEFERNALMQVDARSRALFYQAMFGVSAMNPDDIASRENLNPLPDGIGQRYYVPLNYREVLRPGQQPPLRVAEPQPAAAGPVANVFSDQDYMDLAERVDALERSTHTNGVTP
jgi:HK97 family phage portal protein